MTLTYGYDEYKRLSERGYLTSRFRNEVSYEYESKESGGYTYTGELITGYVSEINDTEKVYTYEYDKRGNITSASLNGSQTNRYVYDDIGQLIREDDILKGKTIVYTYDKAGNISSVKTYGLTAAGVTPSGSRILDIYSYSSSEWGDLLMSYNGQDITYDGIGNPISYYNGFTFSWQGRRLVGATRGSDTLSFTYNDDGIRTSKTVNGVKTTYYLSGSLILAEVTPSYEIMYIYDAAGAPVGMQYRSFTYANGVYDVYFFEKNLQGDILAVYGADGTKYIEYTYDSWGSFTTTYHNGGGNTSAVNNRFTYRGYYYDSDLGMYYLNARYYDQNIRRFINADEYVTTGQGFVGFNMFAYCLNNPVMFSDFSGDYAIYWLVIIINVSRAAKKIMASHNYKHNDKLDQGDNSTYNEMIKNQNSDIIAEYTYGPFSASFNSCEVIAVHNTKVLLGLESTLSETIRDMQTCNGMWLFGLFGSKPSKIGKLLSFYGIEYEKVSIDQVDSPGIYIISYLRSNGMIHTVAVTYDGVDYYAYNNEYKTDHPSKYSSLYFEIYYIRRE